MPNCNIHDKGKHSKYKEPIPVNQCPSIKVGNSDTIETLPDVSESKLEASLPANIILPTNISNKFSFISKTNVPITTITVNKYFSLRLNCFPKIT